MHFKKIVAIIAFGSILALGAYVFSRASVVPMAPKEMSLTTTPKTGTLGATISYTDNGFVPDAIHVKQSQIVRFVNNSEVATWPASAVHPTHSVYPQQMRTDCLGSSFDTCRGLTPGESWEFQFDHVGLWRFHDHVHPSQTGTITVEK